MHDAALSVHLLVKQPELGHALGHLEDLVIRQRRIEPPHLRQQCIHEGAKPPLPYPRHRIVALHT
jgi:hypothetical protein